MKAEHRKELQTNVLADSLGRLAHRVKTKPRRSTVLWVVAAVAIVVVLFFVNHLRKVAAINNSELWSKLEDGHRKYIDDLVKNYGEKTAGKAARFQHAWLASWTIGVKLLGGDSHQAYNNLIFAKKMYATLAEECQNDPVLEPEALYHQAAIEETLAAYDREHLKKAQELYAALANHPKYQDSAYGQMAKERAKLLDRDARDGRYTEIARFYQDLQQRLKLQVPEAPSKK